MYTLVCSLFNLVLNIDAEKYKSAPLSRILPVLIAETNNPTYIKYE